MCRCCFTQWYKYNGKARASESRESMYALLCRVQPRLDTVKELDRMHGLDWYEYGARWQDAAIGGRWHAMDPLCEKYYDVSPYVYCNGSPINKVDLNGCDPGDFFESLDEAALDFATIYNALSIIQNREYKTLLFPVRDSNGGFGFTYTLPIIGDAHTVSGNNAPKGAVIVADAHTHGAFDNEHYDNEFSGSRDIKENSRTNDSSFLKNVNNEKMDDITSSNKLNRISYLGSPNGMLQKYEPQSGKISVVSFDLPSDPNSGSSRVNSIAPKDTRKNWDERSFLHYRQKLNKLYY